MQEIGDAVVTTHRIVVSVVTTPFVALAALVKMRLLLAGHGLGGVLSD